VKSGRSTVATGRITISLIRTRISRHSSHSAI
jgi:hypothetical protein